MIRAFLIAGGVGLLLVIVGLLVLETAAGELLIVAGGFLGAFGLLTGGLLAFALRRERDRLNAETEPVVIDEHGIVCRGIGPIPWSYVAGPERRHVSARTEIGGAGTAMPLTPEGIARVNKMPIHWQRRRLGPQPNFGLKIRFLLLPGVAGLSEDEVLLLFAAAHRRFAR